MSSTPAGRLSPAFSHALQPPNEPFRELLDGLNVVVWEFIAPGNALTYVSRRVEALLGYPAERWLREPTLWMRVLHPDDRARVSAERSAALRDRRELDLEYRAIRRDGSTIWLRDVARARPGIDGRQVRFAGITLDVTTHRVSAEHLRTLERAIASSSHGVLIADARRPGHPIVYVNPAFERITGYAASEVVGRSAGLLHGLDRNQLGLAVIRSAIRDARDAAAVVRNYRKDGTLFWNELRVAPVRDRDGCLTHFVGIQNDITERRASEDRLHYLAHNDVLTGLPNRRLLHDRLAQAIAHASRTGVSVAVVFLDLDHFKVINDTLGHPTGDLLLQTVADRLLGGLRRGDTVARLGGDEFMVVLPRIVHPAQATRVAQKILAAVARPVELAGRELFVTGSVGITLYPHDGADPETLVKNADAAMYQAKARGRNTFGFFSPDMNGRAQQRLRLETSLRRAVERNELVLHYQPQVDLRTWEVQSIEALVRWESPEHALVYPGSFIPDIEESQTMLALSEWVLRNACAQGVAWQDSGVAPLRIAVNVSGRQFWSETFASSIADTLERTGLDPRWLEIEITERMVMGDIDAAVAALRAIKTMGVQISVDDFGTGYSSLSYLKRLPVDTLKIDQSFVRDVTANGQDGAISRGIVAAIIALARAANMRVVAEGVESRAQLDFLLDQGCDSAQGYHLGRPRPPP